MLKSFVEEIPKIFNGVVDESNGTNNQIKELPDLT